MAKRFHVYKVVNAINEHKLISAMGVIYDDDSYTLEYIPRKYTKPSKGKIFAFRTLFFAQKFHNHRIKGGYQIWESLTTKEPTPFTHVIPSNRFEYDTFWERPPANFNSDYFMLAPDGTVLCDDLKLWKQIS